MEHAAPMRILVDLDVPARMRDGVVLRANVYRPEGDGPWPTLLVRLPYSKDDVDIVTWLDPIQAARRGFMMVIQDTRGRFCSDGEWDPFRWEGQDGYDTVEWAARLPGSNGRVGMFGGSYCGNTQWLAAIEQPPSLAAISPAITWSEPMDGLFARGGAVELGLGVWWTLFTGVDYVLRSAPEGERDARLDAIFAAWDRLSMQGYHELPVPKMPAVRRHAVPELGTIRAIENPAVADLSRVAGRHSRVEVPTLHIAGWYDVFLQGTLDNYDAMNRLGRDARLIVGPWTHVSFSDPIGSACFGLYANRVGPPAEGHPNLHDYELEWLARHVDPGSSTPLPEHPVRIFVMGRNVWRDEPSWPPPSQIHRWYLHADGSLCDAPPQSDQPPTEFVYDPADPVPTVGGHLVMSADYPAGPWDQARIEARPDVCVFTSAPLEHDLEVTGRVRVVLHAASSAPSTDWVARLCDVHPDGRSINLCDGIIRVTSGAQECARYEIDLWSTSNVFLRGHRLRLHITSSSFPRWDRNLNTGDQHDPRFERARQTVQHDEHRASHIELPVVRG